MALYRQSASAVAAAEPDSIVERLMEQLLYSSGYRPGVSEQRSWRASLPVLAADLVQAGLPDVELLMEYQLPLTSRRVDVVLAGAHPQTGDDSYVVVELKQWTAASAFEGDVNLVDVPGAPGGARQHPVRLLVVGRPDMAAIAAATTRVGSALGRPWGSRRCRPRSGPGGARGFVRAVRDGARVRVLGSDE